MANLRKIQYASTKTGLSILGRVVRDSDLYYYDFVTGGNTFVATDSANTRISMPARSAPQNYIYESTTFDIETWDDGFYEWQVYDSVGKLLALSRFYIANGQIMFDDYLFPIRSNLAGVKAKTDNLPSDPTSEANATNNKNEIITEINNNETKIDSVLSDTTAIKAKTDNLPVDPTSETNATSNKNSIISEIDDNEVKIDALQGDVTAIKNKTDNLPADPASEANATANKNAVVAEVNINEGKIDSVQGDTTAIKAKTDNLPADPASESNVDAVKAKTDNLPSDPTSETNATANKDEIIAEIDGNEGKLDDIKSDTTAIKGKTDNLPLDPASQSQVEAAIDLVPEAVWEVDINDTDQPTIIQKAKYWIGWIGSIMRKQ